MGEPKFSGLRVPFVLPITSHYEILNVLLNLGQMKLALAWEGIRAGAVAAALHRFRR